MNAFPAVNISKEVTFDDAREVGAAVPDKGHLYRVIYRDQYGWHNEANGSGLLDAKNWAAELLYYEHIEAVAVINSDVKVLYSLTKSELAEYFQRQADTLHAQITAKIV